MKIFVVPHAGPPVTYVTNMTAGELRIAEWRPEEEGFMLRELFGFGTLGQGMPLEVYFDEATAYAFFTTANAGHVSAVDIFDPRAPVHPCAAARGGGGAPHGVLRGRDSRLRAERADEP